MLAEATANTPPPVAQGWGGGNMFGPLSANPPPPGGLGNALSVIADPLQSLGTADAHAPRGGESWVQYRARLHWLAAQVLEGPLAAAGEVARTSGISLIRRQRAETDEAFAARLPSRMAQLCRMAQGEWGPSPILPYSSYAPRPGQLPSLIYISR